MAKNRHPSQSLPPAAPTIALVSTIKNEGSHIGEWLDWHQRLGITHIFIIDDHSTDDTVSRIRPWVISGFVTLLSAAEVLRAYSDPSNANNRHPSQTTAITPQPFQIRCLRYCTPFLTRFSWIGSLDGDEYLCPLRHTSVPDLLATVPDYVQGLVYNWKFFATTGLTAPDGHLNSVQCSTAIFEPNRGIKYLFRTAAKAVPFYSVHTPPVPLHHMYHDADYSQPADLTKDGRVSSVSWQNLQVNHYKHWDHNLHRGVCWPLSQPLTGETDFIYRQTRKTTDTRARDLYFGI